MSVATSSSGGTINNCCNPCNTCKQSRAGKKRGERRAFAIKYTSGGCSGSMKATLKWNCGSKPTNSSALFGVRCESEKVDATWRCVPSLSFGPPVKNGSGCDCPECGKAQVAAIVAAQQSKPDPKTETTSVNWQPQPSNTCPKMTCPDGPCYKAGDPTPPNLPDEPQPDVTWSC